MGINSSDMFKKYRRKPVIFAIQWTGNNFSELENFVPKNRYYFTPKSRMLIISNSDADTMVSVNDYIVKKQDGEFYRCKPDIFAKTYDEMTE